MEQPFKIEDYDCVANFVDKSLYTFWVSVRHPGDAVRNVAKGDFILLEQNDSSSIYGGVL
jgi:hypothetical protein